MGKAGAFRANALDASQISAMETHENRADQAAKLRVKRDVQPLVYSPYSYGILIEESLDEVFKRIEGRDEKIHLSISEACERHLADARQNKAARKRCLHAIIQFPTDLEIDDCSEREMLAQAVTFVNRHHGGEAVFHARLDRDEMGRHAVDVFYAPRYQKLTKRRSETWISLTKFGKALARQKIGQKDLEAKNEDTGDWEPVYDASGDPIRVWCDSQHYQGQALQQAWFEHLQTEMELDWAMRGEPKIGRDRDRIDVEEYKIKQDRAELKAKEEALADARASVDERLNVAERVEAAIALLSSKEAPQATAIYIQDETTKKCFDALPCPIWGDEDGSLGPMRQYSEYAVEQRAMMEVLSPQNRKSDWNLEVPLDLNIFEAAAWWTDFERWWSRKLEIFFVGEDGESGFRQQLKQAVGRRHWERSVDKRTPTTRHVSHIFEPIRELRRQVFKQLQTVILPQFGFGKSFATDARRKTEHLSQNAHSER